MKKILALLMAMLMLTGAAFAEAPALQSFTLTADSSVEMDLDGDGDKETLTWQRETIVGSTLSRVRPKRTIITLAGGSSSVFRKAFAAAVPSISTRSRI